MKRLNETYLTFIAGNSRKFYRVLLDQSNGSYFVTRQWGRIDSRGQGMTETFSDFYQAEYRFRRLEREKLDEGYQRVGSTLRPKTPPPTSVPDDISEKSTFGNLVRAKSKPPPTAKPQAAQEFVRRVKLR